MRDNWIRSKVPTALLEYPFEVVMAILTIFSGLNVLFGTPAQSITVLPSPLPVIWGCLMLGGGIHILVGLRMHSYGELIASGLSVLGYIFTAYAIAIVMFAPNLIQASTVIGLMVATSTVCWARAWWLRVRDQILAERLDGVTEDG